MHILTNNLVPEVKLFLGVDQILYAIPRAKWDCILYMYTYKYLLDHTK